MFSKLFKRNEAVTSIMNAMAKDLERLDSYEWGKLFNEVREHASYSERKWMDIQKNKLVEQWLVTRIAVADLTSGESERDDKPVAPQGFYQSSLAQHVTQHQQLMNQQHAYQQAQMQAHQNMLGGHRGNP